MKYQVRVTAQPRNSGLCTILPELFTESSGHLAFLGHPVEDGENSWLAQLNEDNFFSDLHTAISELYSIVGYFSAKNVFVDLVDCDSGLAVLSVLAFRKRNVNAPHELLHLAYDTQLRHYVYLLGLES